RTDCTEQQRSLDLCTIPIAIRMFSLMQRNPYFGAVPHRVEDVDAIERSPVERARSAVDGVSREIAAALAFGVARFRKLKAAGFDRAVGLIVRDDDTRRVGFGFD